MTKAPIATFFRAAHDNRGVPYTGDWSTLAARLARIDRGTKEGPAFTCGHFGGNTRSRAHLVSRALVALDIEASKTTGEVPPTLPEAIERVRRKRFACAGYESFSSTPELPRYRLVFPLDAPVDLAEHAALDREVARQVAIELGVADVTDKSKLGAESLSYLGRAAVRPEDRRSFVLEGEPINGADLVARAATATCGQAVAEAERAALTRTSGLAPAFAMGESERAPLTRASGLDPALAEIIVAFNEAHPVTQMLTRYDYIRQGSRWKSRHQSAGSIGATSIVPEGNRWISFSQSDRVAEVGRPTSMESQAACWGDAFDLFVHYEHGGDFRAALASLEAGVARGGAVPMLIGRPGASLVIAASETDARFAMKLALVSGALVLRNWRWPALSDIPPRVRTIEVFCRSVERQKAASLTRWLNRHGFEARLKIRLQLPASPTTTR